MPNGLTKPNPVLLVVSFGTSFNESRALTIGAVEQALQAAYPGYEVRRAFTSQVILDILKERDGLEIDNVEQALARCSVEGSRFWFNCNPESPKHWFYEEWVKHPEKHNALRLHFELDDNPALTEEIKARLTASSIRNLARQSTLSNQSHAIMQSIMFPSTTAPTTRRAWASGACTIANGTGWRTATLTASSRCGSARMRSITESCTT